MEVFRLVLFVGVLVLCDCGYPVSGSTQSGELDNDRLKFILGERNLKPWRNGISEGSTDAEAPGPSGDDTTLLLAAKRTDRPDVLRKFKHYKGGWDITDRHYWASVGFTGAAGFILGILWFFSFGLALSIRYCCRWRINIIGKGSERSRRICLIMLIVFTSAAAVGCILLSVGQDKFHGESVRTLRYVVNQSDYTEQTLRNVTEYLSLAKTINVAHVFLPSNVLNDVDRLNVDLVAAADTLKAKTSENAGKIVKAFNAVRSALITVAAVMLILALLGFILSILRHQHAIHIFVVSGWLLVAITFILCGVFIILNNAISDTCIAMEEWVGHPHAKTALSSILPCVDQSTTNKTLVQSKEVINDIANVVNTYIYTFANANPSPTEFNYFNQSGPFMPPLCFPSDSQLQDRQCGSLEVSMTNASMVWKNYICNVSSSGLCTTVGRVTPDFYDQLVAAVNESYALEYYTPVLLSLQDCKFVRDTFQEITSKFCPPLEHFLKIVNAGLSLISVGVLLCLVLWMLYANRPQREEVFVKQPWSIKRSISSSKTDKASSKPNDNNDEAVSNTSEV
ncbi:uncharacterized protein LOC126674369 [Mercurialis annua]|uniref:uncharacterized protein LOC126674369 n=1 Tax=Mercurialis annua TaxID=3986 RepID=UPI002160945C|nr:uncharacterized protein LOC126674369 [Mercurialis annua]